MIDFVKTDEMYFILAFIVPGLIVFFVRSKFITGRRPTHTENILTYLVLSVIYYSLIFPIIPKALAVQEPWLAQAAIWIALAIIGPTVLGFLLGVFTQKEYLSRVLDKLGLTIVHVIPAAWDWRFSTIPRGGMFIMVTLTEDRMVAGYFGRNSFASSDEKERDLYIEEEYEVSEKGEWKPRPAKVGILVAAKDIRYIEFWEPKRSDGQ